MNPEYPPLPEQWERELHEQFQQAMRRLRELALVRFVCEQAGLREVAHMLSLKRGCRR